LGSRTREAHDRLPRGATSGVGHGEKLGAAGAPRCWTWKNPGTRGWVGGCEFQRSRGAGGAARYRFGISDGLKSAGDGIIHHRFSSTILWAGTLSVGPGIGGVNGGGPGGESWSLRLCTSSNLQESRPVTMFVPAGTGRGFTRDDPFRGARVFEGRGEYGT